MAAQITRSATRRTREKRSREDMRMGGSAAGQAHEPGHCRVGATAPLLQVALHCSGPQPTEAQAEPPLALVAEASPGLPPVSSPLSSRTKPSEHGARSETTQATRREATGMGAKRMGGDGTRTARRHPTIALSRA